MKIGDLNEAIYEAERFIIRAREARTKYAGEKWKYFYTCKEVAAAKRASMDLTRVLSKLRNRR